MVLWIITKSKSNFQRKMDIISNEIITYDINIALKFHFDFVINYSLFSIFVEESCSLYINRFSTVKAGINDMKTFLELSCYFNHLHRRALYSFRHQGLNESFHLYIRRHFVLNHLI